MNSRREPDIEAHLTFLTAEQGGRKTACRGRDGGYRPNCDFGLRSPNGEVSYNDILFEFIEKEWVAPGESVSARALFLSPEFLKERLFPGYDFFVHEGGRLVANAKITKVLNAALQKRNL